MPELLTGGLATITAGVIVGDGDFLAVEALRPVVTAFFDAVRFMRAAGFDGFAAFLGVCLAFVFFVFNAAAMAF